MEDFIQNVVGKLGTTESTARSAAGGLLGLLGENVAKDDFKELLGKLPGASSLMQQAAPGGGAGGGGMLGGLLGKAAASVGGGLGSAAGLLGLLEKTGLDASKASEFVGMFVGYIRQQAGPDLVQRLLSKVPELAALAK